MWWPWSNITTSIGIERIKFKFQIFFIVFPTKYKFVIKRKKPLSSLQSTDKLEHIVQFSKTTDTQTKRQTDRQKFLFFFSMEQNYICEFWKAKTFVQMSANGFSISSALLVLMFRRQYIGQYLWYNMSMFMIPCISWYVWYNA